MGKRYYAKNGSLFANSDYNPQEVIVNDFSELVKITDRLEPGAIGRVVGRKQSYELNTDRVWISETGVPFITDEESEELDGGYVQFIDYDGTMIAKVNGEDVANMTKLPANPEHKGLVSQGWNWELDRIKYYMAKYPEAVMTVGQMYCTADGATHIHMNVQGRLTVPLCFQQSVENGVTLDWGDGTATETVAGTGVVTTNHTYAAEGEYILKMKASEDCEMNFGDGESYNIFGKQVIGGIEVLAIEIAQGITDIGNYSFYGSMFAEYITMPESILSIGQNAFISCFGLKVIVIPNNVVNIMNAAFLSPRYSFYISLPESVENIGAQAFSNCSSLKNIFISENVKDISTTAFNGCVLAKNITITEGVPGIKNFTFNSTANLKQLIIPDSVKNIGTQAFNAVSNLNKLTLSKNLETIAANAFSGCYILRYMYIRSQIPANISNLDVFSGIPSDCVIYVPYSEDHSILEAYKTATNWSVYAEQMVEMEPEEESNEPEETPTEP